MKGSQRYYTGERMINEAEVLELYDEEWSTHKIAKKFGTYPNKINRILKKNGRPVRTKSEAQKAALKSGTATHPTEGKTRSDEVKQKISDKVHSYWEAMPETERKRRVQIAKDLWEAIPDDKKEEMRQAATEGIRIAAKEGSKAEKFLVDKLEEDGYNAIKIPEYGDSYEV